MKQVMAVQPVSPKASGATLFAIAILPCNSADTLPPPAVVSSGSQSFAKAAEGVGPSTV